MNERVIEDITILKEVVTNNVKETYLKNRTVTIQEQEHSPDPVIPDKKPVTGGLIQDYVNAAHTSARGGVQGGTIRDEFREHSASWLIVIAPSLTKPHRKQLKNNGPLRLAEWPMNTMGNTLQNVL